VDTTAETDVASVIWDFEQLAERFAAVRSRVIPSSSRGVLAQGPDRAALRSAIEEHCARAAQALA